MFVVFQVFLFFSFIFAFLFKKYIDSFRITDDEKSDVVVKSLYCFLTKYYLIVGGAFILSFYTTTVVYFYIAVIILCLVSPYLIKKYTTQA